MKNIHTVRTLYQMKKKGEKIAALTAYDASMANVCCRAGIDVLLVGDSLGMVFQGHSSTLPTTMEHMLYHLSCVVRGNLQSFLIVDMPFLSYATQQDALINAKTLMQAGSHMVKLEGGQRVAPIIHSLTNMGIPVCGHIGLTPQSVHKFGGYRKQGQSPEAQQQLIEDAQSLQNAGCDLLVLECIPESLSRDITTQLSIPTIGIGAGPDCDGQVLVIYDMLGLTLGDTPPFAKPFFSAGTPTLSAAIAAYVQSVKNKTFPEAPRTNR